MDQDRAIRAGFHRAQNRQQLFHVMTVDGADIAEPQFLEQRPANGQMLQHLARPLRTLLERRGQQADRAFGGGLKLLERRACVEARQIG